MPVISESGTGVLYNFYGNQVMPRTGRAYFDYLEPTVGEIAAYNAANAARIKAENAFQTTAGVAEVAVGAAVIAAPDILAMVEPVGASA